MFSRVYYGLFCLHDVLYRGYGLFGGHIDGFCLGSVLEFSWVIYGIPIGMFIYLFDTIIM